MTRRRDEEILRGGAAPVQEVDSVAAKSVN
jgi:hypothetical protein